MTGTNNPENMHAAHELRGFWVAMPVLYATVFKTGLASLSFYDSFAKASDTDVVTTTTSLIDSLMTDYRTHIQVLSHHCNASSVMQFARCAEVAHEVVERWFDEVLDWSFARMLSGEDLATVVAGAQIDSHAASRLGDHLIWHLSVVSIGRSSVNLSLSATCGGEARVSMTLTLVLSEVGFVRPRPWPNAIRARMSENIIALAAD